MHSFWGGIQIELSLFFHSLAWKSEFYLDWIFEIISRFFILLVLSQVFDQSSLFLFQTDLNCGPLRGVEQF